MQKYYWVDGKEFIHLLKRCGYKWENGGTKVGCGEHVTEKFIADGHSYVPVVDHDLKTLVGLYPLEIYAPNSPTRDAEKFKKIVDKCGDIDDLKRDLEEMADLEKKAV